MENTSFTCKFNHITDFYIADVVYISRLLNLITSEQHNILKSETRNHIIILF